MIMGAYCVGKVHNMLLSSIMIYRAYFVGELHKICYLGGIMIMGAYCVSKVQNMLPQ